MKRIFDIILSLVGLIFLAPLFIFIAILIKFDSCGSVFFVQKRVGRNFKPFNLYKFRTMVVNASEKGLQITAGGDTRITGTGKYLRKAKIDELPQLLNVIKGDMSLVGPRPEVEKYVMKYKEDYNEILKLRPGITDIASLTYSNEEDVLKNKDNPEDFYMHIVLPDKIKLAKEYARKSSFIFDLNIILMTLFKIFYPGNLVRKIIALLTPYRRPIVIGAQVVIFALSNYLSFVIRFDGEVYSHTGLFITFIIPLLFVRTLFLFLFSLDKGLWRYVGVKDLMRITVSVTLGSGVFYIFARYISGDVSYPPSLYVIDWFLNIFFLSGIRLFRRMNEVLDKDGCKQSLEKKLLIVGTGDDAEMFIRDVEQCPNCGYKIVGLVDDDPKMQGLKIRSIPILGTRKNIKNILEKEQTDEILIALPANKSTELEDILNYLRQFGLPIKTLPSLLNILNCRSYLSSLKTIEPEDVLFRSPVCNNIKELTPFLSGKRIMVTGAGGSIGAELSRQIASCGPDNLILYERHEESLFKIDMELRAFCNQQTLNFTSVIGDILDQRKVADTMKKYHPQIVFHAAAYKHVPLMEDNPYEAFKANVIGTKIMAEISGEYGVEKFILISTDKAVNSVNIMGMTKKIAEVTVKYFMQNNNMRTSTHYSIVRFGNVLDSSGSVVPIFKEQIMRGGPLTVTHPEITRYFMTIPEAVNLVLQASAIGKGGEIFVLDMGKPVKILDLAKRMISLYGYKPGVDIDIIFTGLRPGEKLYEELFDRHEIIRHTSNPKIMMAVNGGVKDNMPDIIENLYYENMVRDKNDVINIYETLTYTKRNSKRLNIGLKFLYSENGVEYMKYGTFTNISDGGFSTKLEEHFTSGQNLYINISVNGNQKQRYICIKTSVVWSREENDCYRYGFKFAETDNHNTGILRDYIDWIAKEDNIAYISN